MLSQTESKSPCDSVLPWLMHMGCSCVQIGNTTLPRIMRNVWMIDCNSLNDHLRNATFTKCSDKRLSIDLAALRQMVCKGNKPCTSHSRTFTIHNYGYGIAYTFTHNNIMLEHTAMNNKNTIAHTDAHNTQF